MERQCTVHPRVCGEHFRFPKALAVAARSIPACAGNTIIFRYSKRNFLRSIPACAGNTCSILVTSRDDLRSIPACAGNTPSGSPTKAPVPVHPRVCGEHVRGLAEDHNGNRSIPACAGNTFDQSVPSLPEDGPSPRVRGTRVYQQH